LGENASQHILTSSYVLLDQLIGQLIDRVGQESNTILLSDFGHSGKKIRATQISWNKHSNKANRNKSFALIKSDITKADSLILDGDIYNILPTILQILDVPISSDLSKPLESIITKSLSHSSDPNVNTYSFVNKSPEEHCDSARLKFSNCLDLEKPLIINYYFHLALSYCYHQQYKNALIILKELQEFSTSKNIFNLSEYCKFQIGEPSDMSIEMDTDLTQTSKFQKSLAKLTRAKSLIRYNQKEKARNVLIQAETSCEDEHSILIQVGQVYEKLKDLESARRCYIKASKISPNNLLVINSLANVLSNMKLWDKAIDKYSLSLSIDPIQQRVLYRKAHALNQVNKTEEAKGDLKLALHISPSFQFGRLQLLQLLDPESSEYQAHLSAFNKSIKSTNTIISFSDNLLLDRLMKNAENRDTYPEFVNIIEGFVKHRKSQADSYLSSQKVVYIPLKHIPHLPANRRYKVYIISSTEDSIRKRIKTLRQESNFEDKNKDKSPDKIAESIIQNVDNLKVRISNYPHFKVHTLPESDHLLSNLNELIKKDEEENNKIK